MKPTYLFLLLATGMLASCGKKEKKVTYAKGSCKGNSIRYIATTLNGTEHSQMHAVGELQPRVIYMGTTNASFRVYTDIPASNGSGRVMLNAVVPAENKPGIYTLKINATNHESVLLQVNGAPYYARGIFTLQINSLGAFESSTQYAVQEYSEASGSYTGMFVSPPGTDTLHVAGEFCMDLPEQ